MAQDRELTHERLTQLWQSDAVPVLDAHRGKWALLSDTHFGNGGKADDFRHNEKALVAALEHYHRDGYSLIFLGDTEEFWQFDLGEIVARYEDSIYSRLKAFGDERVHRVYGNHDIDWRTLPDPARNTPAKAVCATEALKMRVGEGDASMLLVHGHQGDPKCDKEAWASRFFVRIFRSVEHIAKAIGLYGHSSATKSRITEDYEQILYAWAKGSKVMLLCGHSHRAIFASKSYARRLKDNIQGLQEQIDAGAVSETEKRRLRKERDRLKKKLRHEKKRDREIDPSDPQGEPLPCYFNTGCGCYEDGLTAVEIAADAIRLVKWHREPGAGPAFEVYREGKLSDFLREVASQGDGSTARPTAACSLP
ncbi:MAG: metallophosphoesterase family protein [candidate division Zixibacteria bacterium]|nr:metallophosphoesterase family protein [candidate division Zixibacteria bacterium]